jgi:hypothetical protein
LFPKLEIVRVVKERLLCLTGLPLLLKIVHPLPTQRGLTTGRFPEVVPARPDLSDLASEAIKYEKRSELRFGRRASIDAVSRASVARHW